MRESYTTKQVADFAGVTERQLDHWSRAGIVSPNATAGAPGSGRPRRWDVRARTIVRGLGGLARLNCPLEGLRAAAEALGACTPIPSIVTVRQTDGAWRIEPFDGVESLDDQQWVVRLDEAASPTVLTHELPDQPSLEDRLVRVEAALFRSSSQAPRVSAST